MLRLLDKALALDFSACIEGQASENKVGHGSKVERLLRGDVTIANHRLGYVRWDSEAPGISLTP